MTSMRKKRIITIALSLVLVAAAGLVYAAWTTNGSGSAYSKAGSAQAISTLSASADTSATLYPGVNGNVTLKVSNPNAFAVQISAVALDGTNADITADGDHSGCTTTGVSFTDQSGLSITVPAKSGGTNGQTTATLTGAVSMSNASLNACQGAVFTIPVTLTGTSSGS